MVGYPGCENGTHSRRREHREAPDEADDGGDRNVDVDKDVDRSRTPGRVVIVQ